MYTEQYRCHSHESAGNNGPAFFYGYCHDSRQMKMMTYPEYVNSAQTTYNNMVSSPATILQQLSDMLSNTGSTKYESPSRYGKQHERHEHDCNCECDCHVHCADAVEYARCGEVRLIPITLENDTRRERNVVLTLGTFATQSGTELGWQATLSDTTFTLPPCGEKTVLLTVPVQCGNSDVKGSDVKADNNASVSGGG